MTEPFKHDLRLRGKTPRVDHVQTSYSILVRDGILNRIKVMPFFANFKFSTNKAMQIQPQSIPFCGVYFLQETQSPDGDADVGEIRFRTFTRIGFSVIVLNNDPVKAEFDLDRAFTLITRGLLSDPTLYNNSFFKIQGFTSGSRQHVFGNTGQDNETPIAELRYELTCDLGTITYPPMVIDDLEVIHVTTAFPAGGTYAEQQATQQVEAEYDIEQGS